MRNRKLILLRVLVLLDGDQQRRRLLWIVRYFTDSSSPLSTHITKKGRPPARFLM